MVGMAAKKRFLEQIDENQNIIHKICRLYAVNTDDRKDLSQEITCQLWKSYKSFRDESKFTTWMYKVALNTAMLNLRQHRVRVRIQSLKEHHADIPAEADEKEKYGQINKLYKAISQLGKLDQAIIMLYLEQLSYKEISEVIGISKSNVSVRLARVKKTLKELLSGEL